MELTYKDAMQTYAEKDWMEFVFFAATVQHLLGIKSFNTQEQLYLQVCNYAVKQANAIGDNFRFQGNRMGLLPIAEPGFILTFHFGQYRAIPAFLIERGYKLCIPVSREVIAQQEQYYLEIVGEDWGSKLLFLEAEDPHLFFKIRRQMGLGFHVLCYLDGGVSAVVDEQRKLLKIPFLNGTISVQQGIIKMASLLNAKISVLIADPSVDNGAVAIRCLDFCDTNWYMYSRDFAGYYLRQIYLDFEDVVLQDPQAWEPWLYLHRTMKPDSEKDKWTGKSRLIPFKHNGRHLLLDKYAYLSYSVSCKVFDRLNQLICV
ncbi:hypothetical protein BWD42_21640 [Sphingobacterium sp. CZ-UAM]|uniref:hypothetical protein n=1 Tax=Sphingobacterium sp. CZ-UAM TaxID=1933868 RepID=UPI000987BBD0|nr:hypothetical protein [Sphingobacterium sp. CZ-UAM]OOG16341.1 hypothetical protein BWD42_21640 [Sphingobacterium sp. CZ-UAM]